MKALTLPLALLALAAASAHAAEVLIRDATVHTMTSAGVLEHTDILIRNGRIAELGAHLAASAGAEVIEASGRAVTPGFFGGIGRLGIEEIGLEPSVDDYALKLNAMRPEFDVTLAFDPDSAVLGVARLGGVTFAQLAPSSEAKGSIVSGQGAMVRLDGTIAPGRTLFVDLGGDANALSGGSRAGQYMLLGQALTEVRAPKDILMNDERLLTPAGRQTLAGYLNGGRRVVFHVNRAADIRQLIRFAQKEKLAIAIRGGAEAWRIAPGLAAAKVPVILDPLDDLPESFDTVGATLENAARLNRAGVTVAFSFNDPEPHNIRKLRQAAGIAVANGLPHEAALAALTRNPAEIFGVAAENGSLARGRPADLVLWSGDPLEVTSLPDAVFVQGVAQPMRSRQTELRDRYLPKLKAHNAR
jgi:imidazolonepropionase-like amidohydrolase